MGNTPNHPKLFEVDEEIRILQDAVNDAKLRKEQIYQKLLIEHPVFAEKVNQSYYSWVIEWIFGE
tara:strand:- start:257 stop:451 length:195 start_codon:yes stop_codon:yes gene_type:complete